MVFKVFSLIDPRAASCSVPLVFSAATILAKDPKTGQAVPWNPSPQRWIDGSVDNDIPITRLAEMFNVNHFIVSQVNPHVVPFLKEEDSLTQDAQLSSYTASAAPSWLQSATHLAKDEALHRMRTLAEIGIFPNALTKAISVLSQKYSGDITIFPEISYADFPRMLSNPTPDSVTNAMVSGERATWPKLSRIKNHCAIELALDDAVQKLRARVVFSPSQVDLRAGVPTRSRSDGRKEGRGKRRERPLSQNSAPATAPPEQPHRSKISKPRNHRKSRSTTTPQAANDMQAATILPAASTVDVVEPAPSVDLDKATSSDADGTSNLPSSRHSSSSTLSITSPFDSPASPPSSPTNAYQSRPFFYSASQPTTPSGYHHHSWGITSSPKSTVPPSRPSSKEPPAVPANFLKMTPKSPAQKLGGEAARQESLHHPPMLSTPRPRHETTGEKRTTTTTDLPHRSQSDWRSYMTRPFR